MHPLPFDVCTGLCAHGLTFYVHPADEVPQNLKNTHAYDQTELFLLIYKYSKPELKASMPCTAMD